MSKTCPNCGITLIDTEAVCSNCGYNLETRIKQNKYSDTNIIYTSKMAKLIDTSGVVSFWLTIVSEVILLLMVITDENNDSLTNVMLFVIFIAMGVVSIFSSFVIRGFSYIVENNFRNILE